MAKRIRIVAMLVVAALLLTGCGLRTVDQLYCLPKRSEAHDNLQTVIDQHMDELEYATPVNGENHQVVQNADLDGDGVDEYLLFAKDGSDKPLKILIFCQLASGYVLMDTIEGYGFAYDFVSYAQLDDRPGVELIVGRQLTDQMVRSVSVYRFSSGFSRQLLSTGYFRMTVCDMDSDGISELFLLNHGETEDSNGTVVLYNYENGDFQRSVQLELSTTTEGFRRLQLSALKGGRPAVYVTTAASDNTLSTDVFSVIDGVFCAAAKKITTHTLNNYFVYPEDMNADGVLDIPDPVELPVFGEEETKQYLLRWSSTDRYGKLSLVLHTFHDIQDHWYFRLENTWTDRIYIHQEDSVTDFYLMGEDGYEKIFTITLLADADRLEQAEQENRIILYSTESVIYVADMTPAAELFGVTQEYIIARFTPIRVEIIMEED